MMATTTFRWQVPPSHLAAKCEELRACVVRNLNDGGNALKEEIVSYAKARHRWQNITGAAEAGLTGTMEGGDSGILIQVFNADQDHGNGLEIWRGGRWGVIPSAMEANYGKARELMERALDCG